MKVEYLAYRDTGKFSKLILDYLEQKPELRDLYNHFPTLENFGKQINEKQLNSTSREILQADLQRQYSNTPNKKEVMHNVVLLNHPNTHTITTGHQLNLFTGPQYFLYKIISVINLCKQLKEKYPDHNFVPVYWMASEDHDFEEINHFNLRGKNYEWATEQSGGVGRFSTAGLNKVRQEMKEDLGDHPMAEWVCELFCSSYEEHESLSQATRALAHRLFGDEGLVIVDADSPDLKKEFIPLLEKELFTSFSESAVLKANEILKKGYNVQVNPRPINLFYLKDQLRERIIKEGDNWKVNNSDIAWNSDALKAELHAHPERFSPNVILRPVYQELILPNLAYVGGGGELAYWLQLKDVFEQADLVFPILMLRNHLMCLDAPTLKRMGKTEVNVRELFMDSQELTNAKVAEQMTIDGEFHNKRIKLENIFNELEDLAQHTDKSFLGAVNASRTKQLKAFDDLEKRFLKAEKRKNSEMVQQIERLKKDLFPKDKLQERVCNFCDLALAMKGNPVDELLPILDPLDFRFTVVNLEKTKVPLVKN